jgi:hypothetical protein
MCLVRRATELTRQPWAKSRLVRFLQYVPVRVIWYTIESNGANLKNLRRRGRFMILDPWRVFFSDREGKAERESKRYSQKARFCSGARPIFLERQSSSLIGAVDRKRARKHGTTHCYLFSFLKNTLET